mgnify:CR=1 FL=1|jgi:ubiquinone/menaquinone biosynthesis C-methylase UbiE
MADFSLRASGREYMDEAATEDWDLEQCLRELARINRLLGGVRSTLDALESLVGAAPSNSLSILDLGTGAGDIPLAMVRWAERRGIDIKITAVDFNPAIVAWVGKQVHDVPQIEVRQQDVFALPYAAASFDIVHAGLFLHHFSGERLESLLQTMHRLCRRGLIVNDLHRHALAYAGIRLCNALFCKSCMVRHDGPQSVLRGFRAIELEELGRRCGIDLALRWRWAFRLVATAVK